MHRSGSLAEKRADTPSQFRATRLPTSLLAAVEAPPSEVLAPGQGRGAEVMENGYCLAAVSPAMRELRRQIEQVAEIDTPVLLVGESGTGKELIARAIHKFSSRSGKFLKVSCAAQPAELLECTLFGYRTAESEEAACASRGLLEVSSECTLLLDKISEMPVSTQVRLMEALGEGDSPLPGKAPGLTRPARLIAATSEDIREAVASGALRPDLYYRLNVFTLRVPPLRERLEDLPQLLNQLMENWAAAFLRPRLPVTSRMLDACASYSWPGNLRELENFVKRCLVLGEESAVLDQLDQGAKSTPSASPNDSSIHITVPLRGGGLDLKSLMHDIKKDAERAAILQALERTGGNKQKAARLLRISLRSLHYKVRAYRIEAGHARDENRFEIAHPAPRATAAASSSSGGTAKVLTMDRTLPAAS